MQYSKSEWKVCLAGRRQRYVWAYALALFCAAITLIGCARASDDVAMDAQSSFKASTPSVAEVSETSVSARPDKPTAVPIAQSQSEQTPPTTSTSASLVANSAPANPYGSPTLDERIFFADAIAIVRPVSIEPVILTVQLAAGQTGYSPVVQSRYEIIEYLKGEGDAEIIVDAKNFSVTLSSVEQALQSAESDAAAQLSSLGRGEAIVFLQRMEHNPDSILDVSRKASETEWRQHNAQTGLFSAGGDIGVKSPDVV